MSQSATSESLPAPDTSKQTTASALAQDGASVRDLSYGQRLPFDPSSDDFFRAIKARQDAYLHKLRGLASLRTGAFHLPGEK